MLNYYATIVYRNCISPEQPFSQILTISLSNCTYIVYFKIRIEYCICLFFHFLFLLLTKNSDINCIHNYF